ncbi:MAG: NAD(P)-dependent oxidoreductase [Pseudomonadota bacterium]
MSRRAAILGLGRRGEAWASLCLEAGWDVSAFDPAPNAASALARLPGTRRAETISTAVRGADWIVCSVPDRLELVQMVLQRAQAEMPPNGVVAVASPLYDVEALQSCTIRPGQIVRLAESEAGGVALDVTERNTPEFRMHAEALAAELAAVCSLRAGVGPDSYGADAESA